MATGWFGLALLLLALALMMTTGWPTYAVLLGVCSAGTVVGLASGAIDAAVLGTLPARIVGLLDRDLLQALALYALVGALLNRLMLADSLYSGLDRALRRRAPSAAPELAGLGLGLMLAPMNGSVGASLMTLARTADARWAAEGRAPARRAAMVALASTLGVIVPPSLVLLLLGDAMLQAHTEGVNLAQSMGLPHAGAAVRIVNTQDILQAALLPGAVLLVLWAVLILLTAPRAPRSASPGPLTTGERIALGVVPLVILVLLSLVAIGQVRAVEAAATAGMLLLCWGVLSRRLTGALLRTVLDEAMSLTGALFALLVAATSFSLLLRLLGTDRLAVQLMQSLQGHPVVATLTVLGVLLACAFVLDAFELIFLVVPIVMPPLLAQVDDAAWVSTLALFALQAGFLLPPFGYAVVLARGHTSPRPGSWNVLAVLVPYLVALLLVMGMVIAWPATTRWLRTAPATLAPDESLRPDQIDQLMREMSTPSDDTPPEPPPDQ
ncbi:TRAP transporter large permease subunit [Variovorax sp. YR216]|uniref:TRAP transporter large permease subunit n=1 Tax=Variovorax sp. YR216 TaxID=1882828 RepID=UPI0008994F0C|nr:TRAP transporter large permease subunit [Variovorax sp. YR216]SEB21884.1 TRAP-type mannitol/chloroaromatic compound transport system, large permease component [Variovorax sp. YR216]